MFFFSPEPSFRRMWCKRRWAGKSPASIVLIARVTRFCDTFGSDGNLRSDALWTSRVIGLGKWAFCMLSHCCESTIGDVIQFLAHNESEPRRVNIEFLLQRFFLATKCLKFRTEKLSTKVKWDRVSSRNGYAGPVTSPMYTSSRSRHKCQSVFYELHFPFHASWVSLSSPPISDAPFRITFHGPCLCPGNLFRGGEAHSAEKRLIMDN